MNNKQKMKIVIAAGGTGGHIFPALSVALQLKKSFGEVSLLWVGTTRSREVELCERHGIPILLTGVAGMQRSLSIKAIRSLLKFILELLRMRSMFIKNKPSAVVAFGGYVCAPVLGAARLLSIPYFIHEQNTVLGMTNKIFAKAARRLFLGFPLVGKKTQSNKSVVVGTPVRRSELGYDHFSYPYGFDRKRKTILICGGSQGAQSMNMYLINPVKAWVAKGFQVVWQTGNFGNAEVSRAIGPIKRTFVFPSIDDLYPYYAAAQAVVCRSGASTLAEVAYFGLPCVMIPLPWATENHQWMNAGVVESQGWGIRIKQDTACSASVEQALLNLFNNTALFESMSRKALDNSPISAAQIISETIIKEIKQ